MRTPSYRNELPETAEHLLSERRRELGRRLKALLESLGPTYVKLGQMLSTRHDLFSEEIVEELELLQDDVAPEDFDLVRRTVEESLNGPIEDFFESFEETPFASASIAQVHRARLKDGSKVCVKVQRSGISEMIRLDLRVIEDIAQKYGRFLKFTSVLEMDGVIAAFRDQMSFELNFEIEAQNLESFARFHSADKYVHTPKCYHELTTRRVMVMEYIDATPLKEARTAFGPEERAEIARRILYSYANQVFRDGFFHGDPHPGNVMISSDLHIIFLDFGIIGRLPTKSKYAILTLFLGIAKDSPRMMLDALLQMGLISAEVDLGCFQRDIQSLLDKYLNMTLHEVKISEITNEFFTILYRYRIRVPGSLTILAKTFIIMEGVVEELGLEQNILEISEPIARKLMRRFVSRDYFTEFILPAAYDTAAILRELPETAVDFMRKMRENGYRIDLRTQMSAKQRRANRRNAQVIGLSVVLLANAILFSTFFLSATFAPTGFTATWAKWGAVVTAAFEIIGAAFFIGRWLRRSPKGEPMRDIEDEIR